MAPVSANLLTSARWIRPTTMWSIEISRRRRQRRGRGRPTHATIEIEDAEVVGPRSDCSPAVDPLRARASPSPPDGCCVPDAPRFTLGEPRNVTVTPTASGSSSCAAATGRTRSTACGSSTPATGEERLLVDPAELIVDEAADLPPDELARRERAREAAGGITSYAVDRGGTLAAFALAGRLFVCDVDRRRATELPAGGPVFDPPILPAKRVACQRQHAARRRARWVVARDRRRRRRAGDGHVGSADFIAAEEIHRQRGFWWRPDGSTIATAPVDNAPIAAAWIADPAQPAMPPRAGPLPVRRHTQRRCRCTLSGSTAASSTSIGTGAASRTSPRSLVGGRPDRLDRSHDRNKPSRSSTSTPTPGRPRCASPTRRPLGRARRRHATALDRRPARHVRRSRWRPAAARRRRSGHPGRPAGAFGRRRRPRRHRLHRQPDRRRHGLARLALRPTMASTRSPTSPASTGRGRRRARSSSAPPRSTSRVRTGTRSTASSCRRSRRRRT